jgi:hypothetical protein
MAYVLTKIYRKKFTLASSCSNQFHLMLASKVGLTIEMNNSCRYHLMAKQHCLSLGLLFRWSVTTCTTRRQKPAYHMTITLSGVICHDLGDKLICFGELNWNFPQIVSGRK